MSCKRQTPKSKTIKISSIFLLYYYLLRDFCGTFNAGTNAFNLDATLKGCQGALQLLKVEDTIHELLLGMLDPLKIGQVCAIQIVAILCLASLGTGQERLNDGTDNGIGCFNTRS